MGLSSVPSSEPSARHDKVKAFVTRNAAAESRASATSHGADLDAFGSEEPKRSGPLSVPVPTFRLTRRVWLLTGLVATLVAAGATAYVVLPFGPRMPPSAPARLTISTTPIGVDVRIDGQPRGLTPLSVQVEPGAHTVTLRRGTTERSIPLQVQSGADMTQHYEFAPEAVPVAQTSTLAVTTDPPGARVLIDGEARGVSPLTISDLSVARHRVTVVGDNGSVERQVTTEAGVTASVVFSLPKAPGVSAGWLAVVSPFEVQVVEQGDIIGTSATPRFMIPAGSHDVELVNEALGFKERRRISVTQGSTSTLRVDARASVSANARPWADVIIDGRAVGQTPISNLSLTLGSHVIVFRHPELGERQQTMVVTTNGPNRVAVDLTK